MNQVMLSSIGMPKTLKSLMLVRNMSPSPISLSEGRPYHKGPSQGRPRGMASGPGTNMALPANPSSASLDRARGLDYRGRRGIGSCGEARAVENIDVARIFDEIADVLELKNDNPFRVRSYRRGARVVHDLPEDVKTLVADGKLEGVSGIGKSLAEKIDEIVKTGTCQTYEEIKRDPHYPLLELLTIPGVGPELCRAAPRGIGGAYDGRPRAGRQGRETART